MVAEEKPAEPDNMKEQVIVNRLPSVPFYCFFYQDSWKKIFLVISFICIHDLSLIQWKMRCQFPLTLLRMLPQWSLEGMVQVKQALLVQEEIALFTHLMSMLLRPSPSTIEVSFSFLWRSHKIRLLQLNPAWKFTILWCSPSSCGFQALFRKDFHFEEYSNKDPFVFVWMLILYIFVAWFA